MKLPPFAYRRAECMEHAVEMLKEHGSDARILAGGQSLVPLMALRLSRPSILIDISKCEDLATWSWQEDRLVVSAAVTARRVEQDRSINQRFPLVTTALSHVGHPEIRNRGTVCGSAAHGDPAAEVPAILLATNGSVRIIGGTGRRRVSAEEFLEGPYTSALRPGELLAGVEFPTLPASAGWALLEIARRHGDFALVGVVCVLDVDGSTGLCSLAILTLFGIAATARRCREAERSLLGQELTPQALDHAAEAAFEGIEILGDIHGSATYRRTAGVALVRRALTKALADISVEGLAEKAEC